jgi:hypothetical protein
MFDALSGIFCFVTASVSFLYGTRIAWVCGKKCDFKADPESRMHLIVESLPSAALVYFFGFLLIFGYVINGFLTILICSLMSAVLLAGFVVSMAMPQLKRKPGNK